MSADTNSALRGDANHGAEPSRIAIYEQSPSDWTNGRSMTPSRNLGWFYRRLRAMGPAEIIDRTLQQARHWTTPSPNRVLREFRLGQPVDASPRLPDRAGASERIREAVDREATSIREGRWLLFGWQTVLVPSPPQWNRDYVHAVDATAGIEARHLNYRNLPTSADARCVWETNRWAEIVKLAQSAWLNGISEDARLAQRWLLDWCDKNPLGSGINWCSPLEAGLRLINFCWIDALVRGSGGTDLIRVQDELASKIVPGHAWWVWRHRSLGSSANNHLLGELAGLVLASRRWPSLARVACSAERAWRLMSEEVLRQFADDGGNREQALHYHGFAWEMAWQAHRVMDDCTESVNNRLSKAASFFCNLVHASEPWDFGDSDDSQVTPSTFDRRTALAEWKAWMLSQEQGAALRFWLGHPPADVHPLAAGRWTTYPVTGLAVQEVNGWKVRVDGSPLGLGSMAAHGHLDAMHVSLWDGEHALIIDPGTGAYYGDTGVRTRLASWEAHNGALPLLGRDLPYRMGPFLWSDLHPAPQLALDGETCSVRLALAGSCISRTIRYMAAADAWQFTDEVAEEQSHVVRWRLAPHWKVVSQSDIEITVAHTNGGMARLSIESADLIGLEVEEDLVSPRFGEVRQGVVIGVTFNKRLVSQWQRVRASIRT
jgi:hypothetical protein